MDIILKTTRHDIILPDGVLSLDENEYNHHHDYEIEFEVEDYDQGLQTFKKNHSTLSFRI